MRRTSPDTGATSGVLKRQARDGYETTAFLVSSRDALTVKLVCAQAEN